MEICYHIYLKDELGLFDATLNVPVPLKFLE